LQRPAHPAVSRPSKASLTAGPRSAHVERTLSWLTRCRRLARNLENLARTSVALIRLAMIKLMKALGTLINFLDGH
jgi:transposase